MSLPRIRWRLGVEIELLAPPGLSRQELAQALTPPGGRTRRFWFAQSEPSLVPGQPVFHNLTPGFEAVNRHGRLIARCVDDLTLQSDLDRERPARPGWFRVVSDDRRLLDLAARVVPPEGEPWEALQPLARLWGTAPDRGPEGIVRVSDRQGQPVAMGAGLPGERERPCELVTPPLRRDHGARLEALLAPARALGFTAPAEGATHLHFDAAPFQDARALWGLVNAGVAWGPALRALVRTNPRCRRLGPWPAELHRRVNRPDWVGLGWEQAQAELRALRLSKYCDLNLRNLVDHTPHKHTIEVRTLPVFLHVEPLLHAAALFEGVLRRALTDPPRPRAPLPPEDAGRVLAELELPASTRDHWEAQATGIG